MRKRNQEYVPCLCCRNGYYKTIGSQKNTYLRCEACMKQHRSLMDETISPRKIKQGFKLRINWAVEEISHSGYCSDHSGEDIDITNSVSYYPLLIELYTAYENFIGTPELKNQIFTHPSIYYYYKDNSTGGYCNCGIFFEIEDIQIVPDAPNL